MADRARCWLVGTDPKDGTHHLVEGVRVGPSWDGEQVVNIRPGCRGGLLVTVAIWKVFDVREDAEFERVTR